MELKNDNIKKPEQGIGSTEQKISFGVEKESLEQKEKNLNEDLVREELKRELDLMQTDVSLKKEAEEKAKKLHILGQAEIITHLLDIAKKDGVQKAISIAESMKDPFILDTLHDALVKEGLYKEFKQ